MRRLIVDTLVKEFSGGLSRICESFAGMLRIRFGYVGCADVGIRLFRCVIVFIRYRSTNLC
jgi:hypothetical protein